jgi:cyclophilin family peptidyl-prolyl cis-trans isomerase/HEAT repeat protein
MAIFPRKTTLVPYFSLGRRLFSPLNLLCLLGAGPLPLPGQDPATVARERILLVEDRRARAPGDVELLLRIVRSGPPAERRAATRALGRLEDRRHVPALISLLDDPEPAMRAEALQALAQALQAYRRDTIAVGGDNGWPAALAALGTRVTAESDPAVAGMLGISLGRLPYRGDAERLEGERRIRLLLARVAVHASAATLGVRGAETIRRARTRGPAVDDSLTDLLRTFAGRDAGHDWNAARRRAFGALLLTGPVDSGLLERALASSDAELRRLAVSALDPVEPDLGALRRAQGDSAVIVRREAMRSLGRRPGLAVCGPLTDALADRDEGTRLLAIDMLGTACTDTAAARAALQTAGTLPMAGPAWRTFAHALVSLARLRETRAALRLADGAAAREWHVRMYAARAAQHVRATALLARLAADPHPNVRDAAIASLRALGPREGDLHALRALGARDYQLLLTAAEALEGTERRNEAARALVEALDRISADGAETSRDTRLALLARLREVGTLPLAVRLRPRLRDFDPVVAESAAALLSAWTGRAARADARPSPPAAIPPSEIAALRGATMRLLMASGDTIEAELLTEEAPLTVARIARLARRGYYDGLTFHRVALNFVIQGGSPGANEYAGDGPYMRDELTTRSHERGTFGISTRGRDTGDAQLFVNLVDNPRLDYDYTVWARVVRGLEALDRIGEGDIIRRLEIRAR